MLEDRINKLRETLNSEIEKCSLDSEAILTLSHDLDELITEYYKYSKNKSYYSAYNKLIFLIDQSRIGLVYL